ncbi:MAG: ATP-binding protein [Acidimicrobiia bacterium]|nr:ATP-binding protein [Acidimicrobiia bacterium]
MSARGAVALPFGPHWSGTREIPGVATCRPDVLHRLTGALKATFAARAIALVTGDTGAGKTFMVARAVERLLGQRGEPFALSWLEFSDWARGALLLRELREQFCADGLSRRLDTGELRRDLRRVLGEIPRLLVLDEAQHVSPASLLMLAKLLDHADTDFALAVVATPAIWRRYPPELRSRTYLPVGIDALADDEVVGVLGAYHPVFVTAEPARLVTLNRTEARGMYRWWAQFLALWWQGRGAFGDELTDDVCSGIADVLAGRS